MDVFNRALAASEVQAIYNASSAGKCGSSPPSITTQPASQSVTLGNNALFSVLAAGSRTLSYQWQLNSTNLSSATNPVLNLFDVQYANAGNYSVIISNAFGSVLSSNALLTVNAAVCTPPPSGLVSWWPGNSSAVDLAGGNNGTLQGGVSYVIGEVGQAFSFNGSGEGVVVGNPASLQLQTFTIDAWIQRSSTTKASLSSGGGLFFSYGSGGYGLGMFDNGQIVLTQVDASNVGTSVLITDTNWHHVAVTKSGSTVVFYIDGVAYPAAAYNPNFVFTSAAAIGFLADRSGNSFLGAIDEVDVFNRALAASEVQAIYNASIAGKCNGSVPPSITSQTTNQTVFAGGSAVFGVIATGSQPLSYQWQFNGTNLSGVINAVLTVVNAQTSNEGNYSVIVSNAFGSVVSSNALLTVNPSTCTPPPSGLVSWWPGNSSAVDLAGGNNGTLQGGVSYVIGEVGQAFSFNGSGEGVVVGNPASLQLQTFTIDAWIQRSSTTKASLSSGGGLFFSYGSGGYGLGMFDNGQVFLTQVDASNVGTSVLITDTNWHHVAVTKSGSTVVFYIDGVAYPAAAYNPNFVFTSAAAIGTRGDNFVGSFLGLIDEVDVFNRALATSEVQAIYNAGSAGKCGAGGPPSITTQPMSQTGLAGGNATFSVVAVGIFPLNYQWQFNGTNLNGATNSALTLVNVQSANAGTYSVTVTNAYGSTTSSGATLTVHSPPSIITQPASRTVLAGNNAIFSVVAAGDPPLGYQWLFNNANISGATTTSLTITNVQLSNAGNYSVTVTNPFASITSSNASLSVNLAGCTAPPSGLVSWWPGNSSAVDLAGGNNGTLQGGVSYVIGEVGQAFSFKGNGEGVIVGNPASLQLQNFTIDAWIQRSNTNQASLSAGGGLLFSYGSGGYGLAVDDNGQLVLSRIDISNVGSSVLITDTNWHHVAVTKSGSTVVFYVDGVAFPAAAYNPNFVFTSAAAIGFLADRSSNSFLGAIDEVDVFNRALAASEVQAIYNASIAGKCDASAPFITTQPANQAAVAGGSASFFVMVAGTSPFNYQWQFNGTNLNGATNSVFTLVNVQPVNAGNYSVTITNAYGLAASSGATLTVHSPPSITTQPASQTVPAGNNATFSVVAAGDPTLNYQWRFNGTNISGATTTSLTVTNVQLTSEGNYSVVVTNPYAFVTSSNASLSVNLAGCTAPPSGLVSWWPGNGNASDLAGGNNGTLQGGVSYVIGEVGQAFSFNGSGEGVVVGNPANLRLQTFTIDAWIQRSSTTKASLSSGGGLFFSYGSGGYGLGMFDNGQLVLSQIDVSQVLSSVLITDTNWHHVAVAKSGSTVVFYIDGVAYPAAAYNPNFVFTSAAAIGFLADRSGNSFLGAIDEVDVFNRALAASEIQAIYNAGSAGKCGAGSPPSITAQPVSQTVMAGSNATFSVVVAGIPPLNYQWQFNGTNLSSAINSALTLVNVQPANAGTYSVTIANVYGPTTSTNVTLTVNTPPLISSQPANQNVATGDTAQFSVTATGTLPLSYQWLFNGTNLTDVGNISGSATANLTVNNATMADAGTYSAIVSNSFGLATSSNAILTIIPAYELSATTAGGGLIVLNPFLSQYPSNSMVSLTATPAGGWTFLDWLDDAQGSNPSFSLIMNSPKKVVARFGTALNTATFGGGAVTVIPSMSLYPYGQTVRLVAQPQPGNYFVRWTNGAAGANNPLTLSVQNNNVTVGAIFAALTNGSNSLTVLTVGFGQATASPPGKNVFTNGATVTLTATPNAGQTFLGWSGSASGTNNPLVVTMNQNQVITANFTVRPLLTIQPTSDLQGVLLTLTGGPTNAYSILKSSDLVTWTSLQTITNVYGESQLTDEFGTNSWFFYKAVGQ